MSDNARISTFLVLTLVVMGCSERGSAQELVVTRDQYGSEWPWPEFAQGAIGCSRDKVTIRLGDVVYGLNGISRSGGDLPDSRELMQREPGTEDVSSDGRGLYRLGATSDLIQLGLRLCSPQRT